MRDRMIGETVKTAVVLTRFTLCHVVKFAHSPRQIEFLWMRQFQSYSMTWPYDKGMKKCPCKKNAHGGMIGQLKNCFVKNSKQSKNWASFLAQQKFKHHWRIVQIVHFCYNTIQFIHKVLHVVCSAKVVLSSSTRVSEKITQIQKFIHVWENVLEKSGALIGSRGTPPGLIL